MKHLNIITIVLFSVGLSLLASCSKDDDVKPVLSRTISSVDVFSGSGDFYERVSSYRFIYGNDGLAKIEVDKPVTEVSYTYYSSDSLGYSEVKTTGGSTVWNKISARLRDGNISACYSSTLGFMSYSYQNNLIVNVIIGRNVMLDYNWDQGNLKITSSGLPYNGYYNTSYRLSSIANEYSIDLNALFQLVDERDNYTGVMNTYGQLIGVLGIKNRYLMENTDYNYNYEYDADKRLSSITMIPGNSVAASDSYSFKIRYKE